MAQQTYSAGPYTTWTDPSGKGRVEYSQPLMFEVEYLVSEGYRRIPHGGIEIGGLLYGHIAETTTRVEEFRLIDCEHASGPSFILSERDLSKLRLQITPDKAEPELASLQVVGWFVAHTRSELRISDLEAKLFSYLFPLAGQVTLLIKPEKFKSTRFAFFQRTEAGELQREGEALSFILPLPTRTADDGDAGTEARRDGGGSSAERRGPGAAPVRLSDGPSKPVAGEDRPGETSKPAGADESPLSHSGDSFPKGAAAQAAGPGRPEPTAIVRSTQHQPTNEALIPRSNLASIAQPPEQRLSTSSAAYPEVADYQLPRRRRARPRYFDELDRAAAPAATRGPASPSGLQFAVILMLAAALGCAVGYWAYLQLPSPVIALSVKAMPSSMLVSWPSEQTREAVYAAIRVDDGPPVLLSAEDRNSGTTTVAGSLDSVKVELIIRHWLRDSRGIVRYLRGTALPHSGQTGGVNGAALRSRNRVSPQSAPMR